MSVKVIKNFQGGLATTLSPVNIEDDQFSELRNMFCYRGSLRPKIGNKSIGALTTIVTATSANRFGTLDSSGNGSFNLLTGLPSTAYVSSQTLLLSDGVNSYSQSPSLDGTLSTSGTATGTINYATGAVTITGGKANGIVTGSVSICLGLPVMGIANWLSGTVNTPIIWDTKYSYKYDPSQTIAIAQNSTYVGSNNACSWNGANFELFSYVNFANSLFCTNGKPAMQFKKITSVTVGATTTIGIAAHGLIVGDSVWFNEIVAAGNTSSALNGQTGTVLTVGANSFTVNINSTGYAAYSSGGIAQYLTSQVPSPTADGIRHYYGSGWVNYAPPVNSFIPGSIAVQYICGCTSMLVFKGRMLLFGVYVATSAQAFAGTYTLLPSTMYYSSIYGINFGSPYYTTLNPINAVNAGAFYSFPAGVYGGSIDFGTGQPILGAIDWKLDYVFITFVSYRLRLYSTASPITPFAYTRISSQYGGTNYTSAVSLDQAIFDLSGSGFIASTAANVQRFDTDILSLYLSVSFQNEGIRRVISYNDPAVEVIYFTFPNVSNTNIFPDTSLLYNYRNDTWAIIDTHFTAYGFLPNETQGFQDIQIGNMTKPWSHYTQSWDFQGLGTGATYRAAGNQCGFMFDIGDENGFQNDYSLPIQAIDGTIFTIPNHNLVEGQVIAITGCVGVTGVNGAAYSVLTIIDTSTVVLDITGNEGTYLGLGKAAIIDNFVIRTKDFNDGIGKAMGICVNSIFLQLQTSNDSGANFVALAFPDTSTLPSNVGDAQTKSEPIYRPIVFSSPDAEDGYNDGQFNQTEVWKEVVINCTGSSVAIVLTKLPSQLIAAGILSSPVNIDCILLRMSATSRLVN